MSKKISLVLGSGGARGITHIGIIKWLIEHDYEIVSVSGTSMGALVGGFFASGKLEDLEAWLTTLSYIDTVKLLDPVLSNKGLIRGNKIAEKLHQLIGDTMIEELSIPFTAVATDIQNAKEFWFKKGRVLDAIRASIAIPNIFVPYELNNRLYLDGGVINPVPVTPALEDNSDILLAVAISGEPVMNPVVETNDEANLIHKALNYFQESDTLEPRQFDFIEINSKSFDMMQESITRFKLAANPPDILLEIPTNICGIYFDFYKAKSLISYGYNFAQEHLSTHPKLQA